MSEKLKPCPFCGGSPIIETDSATYRPFLACICGINTAGGFEALDYTINHWNTRSPDPRVEALVEAAKTFRYSQTMKSTRKLDDAIAAFEEGK